MSTGIAATFIFTEAFNHITGYDGAQTRIRLETFDDDGQLIMRIDCRGTEFEIPEMHERHWIAVHLFTGEEVVVNNATVRAYGDWVEFDGPFEAMFKHGVSFTNLTSDHVRDVTGDAEFDGSDGVFHMEEVSVDIAGREIEIECDNQVLKERLIKAIGQ